jgi:hypothetical protein
MKTLEQRLKKYLIPLPFTGCDLFIGVTDRFNGYGMLTVNGKKEKAHRIAWKLYKGEIPKGFELLHSCDVKSCCNVNHLKIGTHAENMKDASVRKKSKSGIQKLNSNDVKEIRSSNQLLSELAIQYKVTEATISRAKNFVHFK